MPPLAIQTKRSINVLPPALVAIIGMVAEPMIRSRKKEVYVTRSIPEPGLSLLSKVAAERRGFKIILNSMSKPPSTDEIIRNVVDKDAILCMVSDKVDSKVIDAAGPNLKVISTYSSGYDHIDIRAATSRGIYVTFTADIPAEATADLAFALILACARNIVQGDRYVRAKKWNVGWSPNLMLGYNVHGATLGIIGLGRIGSAVARRAKGFGMQVLYYDQYRNQKMESDFGFRFASLDELLVESDFVTIHASMNGMSKGLIDRSKLKMMKKTAFLINTARGQIVNEADLAEALRSNQIAGAGLDVFENEPLPRTSPLLKRNNVIMLPHTGCATYPTRAKMAEVAVRNLLDVLDGKEPNPVYIVNPEARRSMSPLPTVHL